MNIIIATVISILLIPLGLLRLKAMNKKYSGKRSNAILSAIVWLVLTIYVFYQALFVWE